MRQVRIGQESRDSSTNQGRGSAWHRKGSFIVDASLWIIKLPEHHTHFFEDVNAV